MNILYSLVHWSYDLCSNVAECERCSSNLNYLRLFHSTYKRARHRRTDKRTDGLCVTLLVRVHGSLSAVTHAPFHAAQCMSPQGWRKLVNVALLSLINEACVNVCCVTLLSSELVGPLVCRHDRVTQEAGRVGLVSRDRGGGDIEWRCTYLFILPGF